MLMSRLYQPVDELMYHYCSAQTFQSILESGRMRFSDINMLNDADETRWGYSIFEQAATRLLKRTGLPESTPQIDLDFIDSVDQVISAGQLIAHPFVSCFSLDADSLSQWRAYADDGKGFAIGFKAALLKHLPITLLRVEYDKEKQITEMMTALIATYMRHKEGMPDIRDGEFATDCSLIATYMTAFKNPSFENEKEIRCLRAVNIHCENDRMLFADPGGTFSGAVEVSGEKISFRLRDNYLIAHLDLSLRVENSEHPVAEIILGPKNHNALGNIFLFLGGLGISKVEVHRSAIPYR